MSKLGHCEQTKVIVKFCFFLNLLAIILEQFLVRVILVIFFDIKNIAITPEAAFLSKTRKQQKQYSKKV